MPWRLVVHVIEMHSLISPYVCRFWLHKKVNATFVVINLVDSGNSHPVELQKVLHKIFHCPSIVLRIQTWFKECIKKNTV